VLDVGLGAFVDLVIDVDDVIAGGGGLGIGGHIDVAAGAVEIADGLCVIAQILRGEDAAVFGLEAAADLVGGVNEGAGDGDIADVVLGTLVDGVNEGDLAIADGLDCGAARR